MSRFVDIFYYMVALSFAISIANSLFLGATNGQVVNQIEAPNITPNLYTISDARQTLNGTQTSSLDAFSASVGFISMGIGFIVTMFNVFALYNTMFSVFHIPTIIAGPLSAMVILTMGMFIFQLVTGKYLKLFGD